MNETKPQERNPDPGTSLRKLINSDYMLQQMALALPKHLTPERMARCALTALLKNPTLLKADQASFTLALLNLAQWGLEPDGRRAHLVPFWNSKANRYDVVAIPDYKGLAELVLDGGNVSGIHCDLVCDADIFSYNKGQLEEHRIDFKRPRGAPYAVYALLEMKEGKAKCEVMGIDEVIAIRDRSQAWISYKAGKTGPPPWETYFGEMAKKTVFKRSTKMVKLGTRAQQAIEADDAFESRGQVVEALAITAPAEPEPEAPPSPQEPAEERAQADAGLAPATTAKPAKEAKLPPQKELQLLVEGAGHTFDLFIDLAEKEEWLADARSFPDWESLPSAEINRLLRARKGLLAGLNQLAQGKAGGA